jgi:hypothetical protein
MNIYGGYFRCLRITVLVAYKILYLIDWVESSVTLTHSWTLQLVIRWPNFTGRQ